MRIPFRLLYCCCYWHSCHSFSGQTNKQKTVKGKTRTRPACSQICEFLYRLSRVMTPVAVSRLSQRYTEWYACVTCLAKGSCEWKVARLPRLGPSLYISRDKNPSRRLANILISSALTAVGEVGRWGASGNCEGRSVSHALLLLTEPEHGFIGGRGDNLMCWANQCRISHVRDVVLLTY